ncbi:MAG: putative ABC transporter permease subunit [Candidatus Dormibacteraceae bacterium]
MSRSAMRMILGAELLAWRHRLLTRGPARLALLGVFLLAAAVFIGGGAFTVGATAGHFLPIARDSILAGGFTALSVLMLVLGFPTVIATFFVGRELLQLVLAPVRPIDIFVARLLLAMSANLLISSILLMTTVGVGVGSGASVAFFPLAVFLIFVQVVVITALQAILMSLVLQWVPARLARDVAAGVAGLAGAGFYLAWNINLRQSFSPRNHPDLSNLNSLIQRVEWLPSAWPGHALSATIAGNTNEAATWVIFSVSLAAVVLAMAEILYRRTLLTGLGVFGGPQAIWRRGPARQAVAVAKAGAGSPFRAIALKDWLSYRRDIRRLSRMLPAFLFPIGYAFAFLRPSRSAMGFWTDVFLVGFISMFMSTALATPSIPSERRGFQLLRMAPMTMLQVIRAKVMLTLPPVLALTLIFGIVIATVSGSAPLQYAELAILVIWLGTGFVSIGVSAGAIDPRFDAQDDRRAVGIVGSLAGLGGTLAFGLLSIGAFALFIFGSGVAAGTEHLGAIPSTPTMGALMWAVGVIFTAGAALIVGTLVWWANSRLRAWEGTIATT